jgi:hypothetical protein
MKITPFPGNTPSCNFEYFRQREGPDYFVSYYKNSSRLHYEALSTWRVLGVAKHTDTGKALKAWCLEMVATNLPKEALDMKAIAAQGFGPEAHEEPNDNTRMVT